MTIKSSHKICRINSDIGVVRLNLIQIMGIYDLTDVTMEYVEVI
jgi:hypothetical protein